LDNYFEKLFTSDQAAVEGVLLGDGGELAATGATTPVAVAAGSAVVKGKFYINSASVNVSVATPAVSTRKDRVVLRADFTAMTIRITKIDGVEGGDYPAITQTDGTTWDLPLCKLAVTTGGVITLVDERTFCHFGTAVSTAMLEAGAVTLAKLNAAIYSEGAFVWHYAGTLATGALTFEQVAPFAVTLTGSYIIAATAPTGAAAILDVHTGAGAGTTVWTTQANRPTLADGSTGPTAGAVPDVTAIAAGTRLVAAIDQIGSTIAGADVTLYVTYKKALV
jgi:hypothetical protein